MADGPDDPKQKADKAWAECRVHLDGSVPPIRAAVHASIEAALAPVLERVARLEKENAPMTVEALADAVQAVLATLKQREADGPRTSERIRLQFRGGTPFIGGTLQPALEMCRMLSTSALTFSKRPSGGSRSWSTIATTWAATAIVRAARPASARRRKCACGTRSTSVARPG